MLNSYSEVCRLFLNKPGKNIQNKFNLTHNVIATLRNHLSSTLGQTKKWIVHYYGNLKETKIPIYW